MPTLASQLSRKRGKEPLSCWLRNTVLPVLPGGFARAMAALDAPKTLRNSRRLTPGFVSCVMLVVTVGAIVARLLAIGGVDVGRRGRSWRPLRRRRVSRRLEPFARTVAVDVAAHAPSH